MSDVAIQVLRALVESTNLEEFFEKISANLWGILPIRGFQVYLPGDPGQLRLSHQYSEPSIQGPEVIDLDGVSCPAKALKSRQICKDSHDGAIVSVPIGSDGHLTGVLCLHLKSLDAMDDLQKSDLMCIQVGTAAYVNNGFPSGNRVSNQNRLPRRTEVGMTERQHLILQMMRSKLTYYQIGRELQISESLVKLEVSRIFKFLNVGTRAEAVTIGAPPSPN